ncbi:MAG: MFS transporter [Clostridiales bacterium]|nr:MFS transporter [Clostridiales bacterium]
MMVSNFFVASNFYALLSVSASYALSDLGVSETAAGFGAGVFVIGSIAARIIYSRYAARIDFKKTLFIGIGALIVFTALLFIAKSFAIFCVVRFLAGATFGVNNNALMTMASYIIPEKKKGEGTGWFNLSQVLGMALGPFLAVYTMHQYGFTTVFLLETLAAAAAFIAIIFVKIPTETKQAISAQMENLAHRTATLPPDERGIWRVLEHSAIEVAILCAILSLCNNLYMSFAAVFVSGSGAAGLSSAIFLASAGAMLLTRPFIGRTFDKHGPNAIMVFGLLVFAAGLFVLGRGIIPAFLPAAVLLGLGVSSWQGGSLAIVVTDAPRHRLHVANSTYFIALDLGAALGPVLGGKIIEHTSYGAAYAIFAGIAILCLPLYIFVIAKKRRPA